MKTKRILTQRQIDELTHSSRAIWATIVYNLWLNWIDFMLCWQTFAKKGSHDITKPKKGTYSWNRRRLKWMWPRVYHHQAHIYIYLMIITMHKKPKHRHYFTNQLQICIYIIWKKILPIAMCFSQINDDTTCNRKPYAICFSSHSHLTSLFSRFILVFFLFLLFFLMLICLFGWLESKRTNTQRDAERKIGRKQAASK